LDRNLAASIIATTALATLFAVVGLLSLAAGLRWHERRAPALVLAWAMLQHAINQMTSSAAVQAALGGPTRASGAAAMATGYLIAVPWALLVEQVVGRGWKSSIRRTWQVFLAYGVAAIVFDVVTGRRAPPPVPAGASLPQVRSWACSICRPARRERHRTFVLRAGYLVFMALVIHDAVASAGLLPWRSGTGSAGVLAFVGCLAYTVVVTTLAGQRELRAIEHELATARRIQASILPFAPPDLDGATVVFRYVPAAAVAGDLFEFIDPAPRRVGILVADVSGHGVPAAIIASMVKVAAAAQKPHADDPARVLAGIHLALASQLPPGRFVTAAYAHVDLDRRVLRHASAGHPPALVRRAADGSVVAAGDTGPLIISFAPAAYPVEETTLGAGDRVVLYTDGVTEAMRRNGDMFGIERLSALVGASRTARMPCCPPSWTRFRSSRTAGTPLSTMTAPLSRSKSAERVGMRDSGRGERA
jgi:sigma-B regulation protein RsbU (phosphoserine phosphatase)